MTLLRFRYFPESFRKICGNDLIILQYFVNPIYIPQNSIIEFDMACYMNIH